jgi:hypothetical protein
MIPARRVPRAGLIRAQEKGIHDRSPPPYSRRPARRTSNHARTSQVDRAADDPIMRAATSYWAPFQIHPERRILAHRRRPALTTERHPVPGSTAHILPADSSAAGAWSTELAGTFDGWWG